MFKETARRIGEGLLASREQGGTLKWLQGYQVPHPLLEEATGTPPTDASDSLVAGPSSILAVSGEKSDSISTPAPSVASAEPAVVTKKRSHFTDATAFLKDGFEELLKCRCVS